MMISRRGRVVESFKVMEVLRRANEMEASGRKVLHLEVGQPRSGAPPSAVAAATRALAAGEPLGYTNANGTDMLRRRIAAWYAERHGAKVDPERVVVTTGSSAGFVLSFAALFDPGDAVAVPSTAYPCYRNVLRALGCEPVEIASSEGPFRFPGPTDVARLAAERERRGATRPRGLVVSSPANPTGATLDASDLGDLATACRDLGISFVSDEIYHHLGYEDAPRPASAVDLDGVVVVNSFSKFFSMTGWRVGWLVLPSGYQDLAASVHKLQQNLNICAPAVSQVAAAASFDDVDAELADHVSRYAVNRAIVLEGLRGLGIDLDAHVAPASGAFYVYADLGNYGVSDSSAWCAGLLQDTAVALTPGLDFEFDRALGDRRVRFSYCGDTDDVALAMDRLRAWWRPP
ncbi:hypothetical protein CTAYLR_003627 [Chrysophaeum taylorii]|uniref:Aminotransferase class I/classII large domain-containing protein n=1 Tax=Chrysophaeum taylorii TaxID=2483200 RepID=A0AAD7UD05_9STRA|nr:hypothetical protein CTAYLR_003627 [Chrysophaeum taylorii]